MNPYRKRWKLYRRPRGVKLWGARLYGGELTLWLGFRWTLDIVLDPNQ